MDCNCFAQPIGEGCYHYLRTMSKYVLRHCLSSSNKDMQLVRLAFLQPVLNLSSFLVNILKRSLTVSVCASSCNRFFSSISFSAASMVAKMVAVSCRQSEFNLSFVSILHTAYSFKKYLMTQIGIFCIAMIDSDRLLNSIQTRSFCHLMVRGVFGEVPPPPLRSQEPIKVAN